MPRRLPLKRRASGLRVRAGASITASFAPMVPVNTAVMAGLLGQEVVSRFTVAGIAVAVIGTFSILRVESLDVSSDRCALALSSDALVCCLEKTKTKANYRKIGK